MDKEVAQPTLSTQSEIISLGYKAYTPNYNPRKLVLRDGLGSVVHDFDGRKYIDFGSGIGVNSLGHRDSEIVNALSAQANLLWHTSNIYFSEQPVLLAAELTAKSFAERVFFCNSGAEANEAAIKIVRKFASENYPEGKRTILTFEGSFHGRTLAALTATAQPKYQQGFEPLPGGFRYCKFNHIEKLHEHFNHEVCAVMLEPIQGESGIRPAEAEFLVEIDRLCRQNDALLVFDEIQCGMGRTGKLFAYEWVENLKPDIVTIAKAFGGGLPIGATLTGPRVAEVLDYGSHGSTFGGNPICCAVANVVLNRVTKAEFLSDVERKGSMVMDRLMQIDQRINAFSEIRGKGLMIGAELRENCGFNAATIMDEACIDGLLILQAGPMVVRLLPALTINDSELLEGLDILERVFGRLLNQI